MAFKNQNIFFVNIYQKQGILSCLVKLVFIINLFNFLNTCVFCAPFNKNAMLDNFVNYYVLHFLDDKQSFKKLFIKLNSWRFKICKKCLILKDIISFVVYDLSI